MQVVDNVYTANMTQEQRSWFFAEYEHARRDEVVGVLLAIFLGSFGIHHFYLRRNGLGVLYLCLSWTGVPAILGFIDAFFTPRRVRRYNAEQAAYIADQILRQGASFHPVSPPAPHCSACGGPMEFSAAFCPHCGTPTNPGVELRSQTAS